MITRIEFERVVNGWTCAVYRDSDPHRTEYVGATWDEIKNTIDLVVGKEPAK